ncbi:MAG TPA: 2Fe-2S iron-sulfur cluster-binding protein [Bacillota bacterium]|nr:2Fe-2S iron-sulfur cluster-binding protein [Bacillota bacterium]
MNVTWEGQPLPAQPGQSLAAALWAAGVANLGGRDEAPRGLYCGVGHCASCRVVVAGTHGVRACLVRLRDGLRAGREPEGTGAGVPAAFSPATTGQANVAVVGAGPAGLAAAAALVEAGATVDVFDETPAPLANAPRTAARIHHGASVWGIFPGWRVFAAPTDPELPPPPAETAADALILATGAVQLPLALPGWTLPGVVTPWGALHLLDHGALRLGARVVIVGTDPTAQAVANRLRDGGAEIAALLPPQPSAWVAPASGDGPFATGFLGTAALEAVTTSAGAEVPADLAVVGAGLAPLCDAVQLAGGAIAFIPELGGHVAVHGPRLQSTEDRLFVAGDLAGLTTPAVAAAQGHLAGLTCAASLGLLTGDQAEARLREAEASLTAALRTETRSGAASGRAQMVRLWAARPE